MDYGGIWWIMGEYRGIWWNMGGIWWIMVEYGEYGVILVDNGG